MIPEYATKQRMVYCDSLDVIEAARASGVMLPPVIRSHSPALLLSGDHQFESADADPARLNEYWAALGPLTEKVFRASIGSDDDHDRAVLAARAALQVHRDLTSALKLSEVDFLTPSLVLRAKTGSSAEDVQYDGLWTKLLRNTKFCELRDVRIAPRAKKQSTPPLFVRSIHAGWAEYGYKVGVFLWRKRGPSRRPVLLVDRPSEAVRETAFHLMLRGFIVTEVERLDLLVENGSQHIPESVLTVFRKFLDDWFPQSAIPIALDYFAKALGQSFGKFEAARRHWSAQLPNLFPDRRGAILTFFPGTPEIIALGAVGREKGIPLVAFQHGVAREINSAHKMSECTYENAVSDILFTFNEAATDVSRNIPFARGRVETVGMRLAYGRLKKRGFVKACEPILYVSTTLLSGNINLQGGSHSDAERVRQELTLIDQTFVRLPHAVAVKLYPAAPRYAEPDLVAERLEQCDNVRRLDSEVDLRYLVSRFRVIVTSRATSTLSWCLMSDLPLVFLNSPNHAPLKEKVRTAISDAVFLFDWSEPDMLTKLRIFLSRPLTQIEDEWSHKADARRAIIRRYIAGPGTGSGRRAAEILEKMDAEQCRGW